MSVYACTNVVIRQFRSDLAQACSQVIWRWAGCQLIWNDLGCLTWDNLDCISGHSFPSRPGQSKFNCTCALQDSLTETEAQCRRRSSVYTLSYVTWSFAEILEGRLKPILSWFKKRNQLTPSVFIFCCCNSELPWIQVCKTTQIYHSSVGQKSGLAPLVSLFWFHKVKFKVSGSWVLGSFMKNPLLSSLRSLAVSRFLWLQNWVPGSLLSVRQGLFSVSRSHHILHLLHLQSQL